MKAHYSTDFHRKEEKKQRGTPEGITRNTELPPTREGYTEEDFRRDLCRASARVVAEIEANPAEAERLQQAKDDVAEGRVRWDEEDDDAGANGPDTPADHNEEGHAKRPSGDPACDGGSVRAGSVVRPVDGGGGRPDRGRAARSVWQTLGDTPADSQEGKA